jgi:hypothetical protein
MMDVKMKVLGTLVITAIGGKPAAAMLSCDTSAKIGRNDDHLLDDGKVARLQCRERRDMTLGDDDDMHGPVGLRMVEGENLFRLSDALDNDTP